MLVVTELVACKAQWTCNFYRPLVTLHLTNWSTPNKEMSNVVVDLGQLSSVLKILESIVRTTNDQLTDMNYEWSVGRHELRMISWQTWTTFYTYERNRHICGNNTRVKQFDRIFRCVPCGMTSTFVEVTSNWIKITQIEWDHSLDIMRKCGL